jgi:queuine tRNA-ribosyltransferase
MEFRIIAQDPKSKARTGKISTAHGEIDTPMFMPVGTAGTVKGIHQRELVNDIAAQIILGNTYHLYLRPGVEVISEAGGIHKFMNWNKPVLTDSGGYQVYSLSDTRKIKENGVTFNSHIDGSHHIFTPENVIEIQRKIGADIIMTFDECTPYPCEYNYAKESMEMTHRWLERCKKAWGSGEGLYGYSQALFPIVQGSIYKDLRKESAAVISSHDLPGNAIGGLSVGEPMEKMYTMTELVCEILPTDKPRYLMGVGMPENILECIGLGIDMFDCVIPTRNGRNGMLFTSEGIINIRNEKWKKDFSPIDHVVGGYINETYSKAYLRHLIISNEILGAQIATLQNLMFYLWLIEKAREEINNGTFLEWKTAMIKIVSQRIR